MLAAFASMAGCDALDYYGHSIGGHLAILHAARPIDDWLGDPDTPAPLKARLRLVEQMRAYASQRLDLPDNSSYRSYAQLNRPFVVWNVFAAPELSMDLKKWCFPVAGCVAYRGYFDRGDAMSYAADLRRDGWDVQVGGVPAYSTLGWTADPVLSTFVNFPDGEVARLIFHELAHQKVYLSGDSTFNESFATSVEEEGVRRWMNDEGTPAEKLAYDRYAARKKVFLELLMAARDRLTAAYAAAPDDGAKLAAKNATFADLRSAYEAAKADPSNALYAFTGYDPYFAQPLNNANLASIATYTQNVPLFTKLLADVNGDLPRFYAAVKSLSEMSKNEREQRFAQLSASLNARAS